MRNAAFIFFEQAGQYTLSGNHPYRPDRARAALQSISRLGLLSGNGFELVTPRPVTVGELAEVHGHRFLTLLEEASRGEHRTEMLDYGIGSEECPVFAGLMDFLRLAAGATVEAARGITELDFHFAFNPVGGFHHAGVEKAEGFCYVNDVCLVARRWADGGLKVLVLDIDAHHGNGTQDFFYHDPHVLTVSFHESGKTLYPFGGEYTETGAGEGDGYNVNVPLPARSDDEVLTFAFDRIVPPLFELFAPDVTIGVMGVDMHSTDPLTHLNMTNNSYLHAARVINRLAPRWIALGAGGYNPENVVRGYTLLWAAATGQLDDDMALANLGGTFLGEMNLGLSSLHDMAVRSSGPEKVRALLEVQQTVEFIETHQFRILGGG